jgi:hypothetical protein
MKFVWLPVVVALVAWYAIWHAGESYVDRVATTTIDRPPDELAYKLIQDLRVSEFRLNDGTRCVATNKGGVVCQWRYKQ